MSAAQVFRFYAPSNSHDNSHVVQFYDDEAFLIDDLSRRIGPALAGGDSAVVIATQAHLDQLRNALTSAGLDLAGFAAAGRYVELDAAQTLAMVVVNGAVNRERFLGEVAKVISLAASAAPEHSHVVVFGEMVALLVAEGQVQAAIQMERLWNELARTYRFSLRCAYPADSFGGKDLHAAFLKICAEHSDVIPVSGPALLRWDSDGQGAEPESEIAVAGNLWGRNEWIRLLMTAIRGCAIVTLDAQGRVADWSSAAQRLNGFTATEIVGKHIASFHPAETAASGKPQHDLEIAANEGWFEEEQWWLRKDDSRFWANIVLVPLKDGEGNLAGYGMLVQDFADRKKAETALRRSRERFQLLVESIQDCAIFMLDVEGRVSSWNPGAEKIKGYKASEIMGCHFSCFYSREDVRSGKPEAALKRAAREGRFEDEGWRIRKDGSRFWASVILTALKDHTGNLVGFAKVTRDFTERRQAQQRLSESERSLRRLSLHLLRSQDEERKRIGRDLHDSLGQYLAALKMSLDRLAIAAQTDFPLATRRVEECCGLIQDSIRELRTISYLMYPPMLEETGLKSAIAWYLEGFRQRSGISTSFEISPDFGRLERETELAIFRVLQESLTNVHRHSGSLRADVRLFIAEQMVVLQISDEGKGLPEEIFDSAQDSFGALGVGLRGMNERMRQLGGLLEVSSNGNGTTITARVPYVPEATETHSQA